MALVPIRLTVDTDGSGDGVARVGVPAAVLEAVEVNYGGVVDAGCDVTITVERGGVAVKTLLTRSNSNVDLPLVPVLEVARDTSGAAIASGESLRYVPQPIDGNIVVTVAQAGGAISEAVKVLLLLRY